MTESLKHQLSLQINDIEARWNYHSGHYEIILEEVFENEEV
jgi:hypothetical protein